MPRAAAASIIAAALLLMTAGGCQRRDSPLAGRTGLEGWAPLDVHSQDRDGSAYRAHPGLPTARAAAVGQGVRLAIDRLSRCAAFPFAVLFAHFFAPPLGAGTTPSVSPRPSPGPSNLLVISLLQQVDPPQLDAWDLRFRNEPPRGTACPIMGGTGGANQQSGRGQSAGAQQTLDAILGQRLLLNVVIEHLSVLETGGQEEVFNNARLMNTPRSFPAARK